MNKTIMLFAILFTSLSFGLSSCDDKDDGDLPQVEESSYTFTFQGLTSTVLTGEISVCNDGYFIINGLDPNGDYLSISMSEIFVGETRDLCTEDASTGTPVCIDNGDLLLNIATLQSNFFAVSGSATRTSDRSITVSGVAKEYLTGPDLPFTLEATAGLLTPIDCR